jgi:hypothetical protein
VPALEPQYTHTEKAIAEAWALSGEKQDVEESRGDVVAMDMAMTRES